MGTWPLSEPDASYFAAGIPKETVSLLSSDGIYELAVTEFHRFWHGQIECGWVKIKKDRPKNVWGVAAVRVPAHNAEEKQVLLKRNQRGRQTALQRPSITLTGSSTERMSGSTWSHAASTRHSRFINTPLFKRNHPSAAPDAHDMYENPFNHSCLSGTILFLFNKVISINASCWLSLFLPL